MPAKYRATVENVSPEVKGHTFVKVQISKWEPDRQGRGAYGILTTANGLTQEDAAELAADLNSVSPVPMSRTPCFGPSLIGRRGAARSSQRRSRS